jgi:predicted ATPase
VLGHRLAGVSEAMVGNLVGARTHLDRAIESYDPAKHRQFAARFGQDIRVGALSYRGWVLWMLGYQDAALADAKRAVKEAREGGQGISLLDSLYFTSYPLIHRGEFAAASAQLDELIPLLTEKNASQWRGRGLMHRGFIQVLTGKAADAVEMIPSGIEACQSSGSTLFVPWYVSHLARAYGELGRFDAAWLHIDEALKIIGATGETWCESDVHRTAGEIALLQPVPDAAKAEMHLHRALEIARAQQAKSWELRAAASLAKLLRDQGHRDDARELLSPIYGWFSEGFDTLDLKRAKSLLSEFTEDDQTSG